MPDWIPFFYKGDNVATWINIVEILQRSATEHALLDQHFKEFASEVSRQINHPSMFVRGMTCSNLSDSNTFEISFAGKTVMFAFDVIRGQKNALEGRITAYLRKSLPKPELVAIHTITFDKRTMSSEKDDDGDSVCITSDIGSLRVALGVVEISLNY